MSVRDVYLICLGMYSIESSIIIIIEPARNTVVRLVTVLQPLDGRVRKAGFQLALLSPMSSCWQSLDTSKSSRGLLARCKCSV